MNFCPQRQIKPKQRVSTEKERMNLHLWFKVQFLELIDWVERDHTDTTTQPD